MIEIDFNENTYEIPQFRDVDWANQVTSYLVAISTGTLQPSGGTFSLTAEVDFGANFGLKTLYYKSRGTNISTAGILRLASAESIGWRNNANSNNLLLTTNASDELLYNGAQVLTGAGPSSYVSSITGTANQVIASGSTGAVTLSLPQSIATSSNLQFGTLGLGAAADSTAILSVTSTAKGFLPPRMTTVQRDAIGTPATGLTIYNTTTNAVNVYDSTQWLPLAMSGGGTVNTGSQYQLGYYAAAGTTVSPLPLITASRALVSDANGLPVASTATTNEIQALAGLTASRALQTSSGGLVEVSAVTATELGYVSGVTSTLQTQLNAKAPAASPTFTGTVTIPTPFTLGAVSVTTTGTELNYVTGVTSAIQTQIDTKAPIANPTFTTAITSPLANLTNTTNQLVLGTTNTVTITSPAPAASRVLTIPDPGGAASFVMTEGTQTINGSKTFGSAVDITTITHTGGTAIQGTNTNDSAAAGNIGEVMTGSGTLSNTGANDVWVDATSLALTAGDWDINFSVFFGRNTATWSRISIGVTTTSGNSSTGIVFGQTAADYEYPSSSTTPEGFTLIVPGYRISIASTTTYYAKVRANFSAGQPQYAFRIQARRAR